MKQDERDERMIQTVRRELDRSTGDLDGAIAGRLAEIRAKAVAEAGRRHFPFLPRWVTVGGVATLTAAAVAGIIWFSSPSVEPVPVAVQDDPEQIELIAANDHIQLYEDIEFYHWLAAQENQ